MNLLAALALCLQWDQNADAEADLLAACEKARGDHRRVLVAWGSDDEASRKLAETLQDRGVARKILYEYVLVYVHKKDAVGLTILSADAKERAKAEALDAKSILAFLEKHQCEPRKADDVLKAALDKAAAEKKRVLLVFGAPW